MFNHKENKMSDLIPCPFCGSTTTMAAVDDYICYGALSYVHCVICGAPGPTAETDDEARLKWSIRADDKPDPNPTAREMINDALNHGLLHTDIEDILVSELGVREFDGLYNNEVECGCQIDGINPGNCLHADDCRAGYENGDGIGPDKPNDGEKE